MQSDPLRSMRKNHNRKQAEEVFTLFSLLFVFDEREERWGGQLGPDQGGQFRADSPPNFSPHILAGFLHLVAGKGG